MRSFLRLLKLVAPFRWWIVLAALLGFATIGSSIGLLAAAAYIISMAALHPSIAALQVAIVGVRFFGLSRGVFRYLERYVSHQVTFKLLARLRVWFYQRLEPLAPAGLLPYHSGDLLTRLAADIDSLEHFYVRVLAPPVVAALVIGLLGLWLTIFAGRLALAAGVFLLLAGVGLPLLTRYLSRKTAQQLVTRRAELNTALVDGIQGMADLLIVGNVDRYRREVNHLGRELVKLQQRMARVTGLAMALSGLFTYGAVLAVLALAIPLVSSGYLSGVYLAVLALAVMAAFEAVVPLPGAFQHLESSLTAGRRLFELVDATPVVPDLPGDSPSPQDYSLTIENLTFSYTPSDPPALNGLNLTVPAGGFVAIVGPSGAGKSTLMNVLLRFWDYQEGHIRLGGHDLRRYRPEEARRLMAVVSQRTHLFNGAIKDNLLLARPDATEADLVQAAQQAQLYDFIQTLPAGFDTWIGEQGLRLSGGERQRLAIARALLQNAPILLLDEPTANLDPLAERDVMQALLALRQGRTTLLITHRLVGLDAADEILVLQAGRLIERGRHHELLQADTLYRRLYESQRQVLHSFYK